MSDDKDAVNAALDIVTGLLVPHLAQIPGYRGITFTPQFTVHLEDMSETNLEFAKKHVASVLPGVSVAFVLAGSWG